MHKHITAADGTELVLIGKVPANLITARLGPWSQQALCAQTDSEIFFPAHDDPGTEARQICQRCLVRVECLRFALSNDERFGIWGGLDVGERAALQRKLRQGRPRSDSREGVA